MLRSFSAREEDSALEDLKNHFNNASLVHISIDFQKAYSCSSPIDRVFSCNVRGAAHKTADLSPQFAKINIPNWWITYRGDYDDWKPGDDDFFVVKPARDDLIIKKLAMSAFVGSWILDEKLQDNGIKALLISGLYREQCVYETVKDACRKGYKVFVMEDCVGGFSHKDKRKDFEKMREEGAIIIKSEDVLRALAPDENTVTIGNDIANNDENPIPTTSGDDVVVGKKRDDGTIYLGYHRGRDWFTTAEDAQDENGERLTMNFNDASGYTADLEAHGHNDWELANKYILDKMYKAQNKGAFDETYDRSGKPLYNGDIRNSAGWYWSSTKHIVDTDVAWVQQFSYSSVHLPCKKDLKLSIRPIRSELRL